ncbi:MAG TPA: ATP-binding cassette domain-containing protein, partial [Polyangiaceae bacterium]|nr:ATP-binding cassette domain-containing protein [Polyangiaceae bacterium]
MIAIEGLSKRYGAVRAVNGVSFRADDGKVTGLLGPNGAGKTTTLRMLSSLVRPDAGRALVDGVDVTAEPHQALARLGVLPDGRGLYPRLSAREHLEYFGALHGLAPQALRQRIEHLVQLLDMGSIIDRRVVGFSQGERTKVAI